MEFKKETRPLSQADADVLIVVVFQDEKVEEVLPALDPSFPAEFAAAVAKECSRESFTGKAAQTLQLPTYGTIAASRLLVKGGGKRGEAGSTSLRKAVAGAARRLSSGTTLDTIAVYLPPVPEEQERLTVQSIVEGWLLGSYQFKKYKT